MQQAAVNLQLRPGLGLILCSWRLVCVITWRKKMSRTLDVGIWKDDKRWFMGNQRWHEAPLNGLTGCKKLLQLLKEGLRNYLEEVIDGRKPQFGSLLPLDWSDWDCWTCGACFNWPMRKFKKSWSSAAVWTSLDVFGTWVWRWRRLWGSFTVEPRCSKKQKRVR